MSKNPPIGINRIMQPNLSVTEFLRLAAESSVNGIEIRNDLADTSLLGGIAPEEIRRAADDAGVSVMTVNALQRFNDPELFDDKLVELRSLMEAASLVDCRMIVLCPVNDPEDRRSEGQQKTDLETALITYAHLFEEFSMLGLVEPLGFEICSVRYKKQAVDAIAAVGRSDIYKIVHDTFHHHLSGESDVFPESTGLIHVSGVRGGKKIEDLTDDDRVLVDENDVMNNHGQVARILAGDFDGILSFEPFSPEVQNYSYEEVKKRLGESVAFLLGE